MRFVKLFLCVAFFSVGALMGSTMKKSLKKLKKSALPKIGYCTWTQEKILEDSAKEAEAQFLSLKANKFIRLNSFVKKTLERVISFDKLNIYDYRIPGDDSENICGKLLGENIFKDCGVQGNANAKGIYEQRLVVPVYAEAKVYEQRVLVCPCEPLPHRMGDRMCFRKRIYFANGLYGLHFPQCGLRSYFVFKGLERKVVVGNELDEVRVMAHMILWDDIQENENGQSENFIT